MSLFNTQAIKAVGKDEFAIVSSTSVSRVMDAVDHQLLREIVSDLASKITEEIYPEVLKALDKEVIVEEVSIAVSEKVLSRMFGEKGEGCK